MLPQAALRVAGDVGANVGTYTIWAAECGAEVIALEPAADTFGLLLENVALNGYQVEAIQAAAGLLRHRPVHRRPGRGQPPGSGRPGRDRAGHDRLADRRAARGRHEGRCRGLRDRRAPGLHPRAVRAPHRADAARMEPASQSALGADRRPWPICCATSMAIAIPARPTGTHVRPSRSRGSAPMSLPVPQRRNTSGFPSLTLLPPLGGRGRQPAT